MRRHDEGIDRAPGSAAPSPGALADLFAIGRCVERSDGVARLLDAHLQRMADGPWLDEHRACALVLDSLGVESPAGVELRRGDLMAMLAVDRSHPASIAFAIGAAREHARHARDAVPAELWECLNTSRARMPRKVASDRAHDFLAWVRERAALAVGTVEVGLGRDDSWSAFTLGRDLERAERTVRLLAVQAAAGPDEQSWSVLLRSCGAYEAAQRGATESLNGRRAAGLLLRDAESPRSVRFAVQRAERCLRDLGGAAALREIERVRPLLDAAEAVALDGLPELLHAVRAVSESATDALRGQRVPSAV